MFRGTIAAVALLAAACAGGSTATAAPTRAAALTARTAPAVAEVASLETSVLDQLNRIRRAHGLDPLKLNAELSAAAEQHSREMGADGYFEHTSANGAAFWKRVARYYPSKGFRYWSVGENLLWASPGVDGPGALKLWMASPEHRKNILTARWREVGVAAVAVTAAPGAYNGLDVTIVTTDFGVRR